MVINEFKAEKITEKKPPSEYLDEVKTLLWRKNYRKALDIIITALQHYPYDPFLLSYYGCLEAIINKNYKYGVNTCLKAIEILNERIPFGQEIFYPVFYLNLGKASLAAKNKKNIMPFREGCIMIKITKNSRKKLKK